eukprot:TRINITY_DN2567_c0_g1_i4.p1 TRINITY_DN2567_c0_g1~~TRINITY_DN2567_c0_g1_i4.p1  ORF type:complete len:376 (+),score=63.50 TRINITY_DN2567_c0_g1_i4:25-1128(+)
MNDPTCPTVCYNRQWVFSQAIGAGGVVPGQTFRIREETFDSLGLQPGEAIIKTEFVFLEPFWEPSELGAVQPAAVVATVVAVNDPEGRFRAHDIVEAFTGWQLYAKVNVEDIRKLGLGHVIPGTADFELAVLGVAGRAAFFGFLEEGRPKKGETVVINGAYGAAAEILVRLAKRASCRIVVITHSYEQYRWADLLTDIDEIVDQTASVSHDQSRQVLAKACPKGVDVLVDLVGGLAADVAFGVLNTNARVVVLGHLPHRSAPKPLLHHVLLRRVSVKGVHPLDYRTREREFLDGLEVYNLDPRKLSSRLTIKDGLENLPAALQELISGTHVGGHVIVRADYRKACTPLSPALPAPESPRRLQVTLDD